MTCIGPRKRHRKHMFGRWLDGVQRCVRCGKHMKRCTHKDKLGSKFIMQISRATGLHVTTACYECGYLESLGPANDTPAVMIEIRAAELALLGPWWNDEEYDCEAYGVLQFENGGTPGCDEDGGSSSFAPCEWAGWLARQIATHTEDV